MKYKLHFLSIVVLLVLSACESVTSLNQNPITVSTRVPTLFVLNEGNFGHNNSSLDAVLFKPDTIKDTVHNTTTIRTDTIIDHNVLTGLGEGNDILVTGNHVLVLDFASNVLKIVDADSLKLITSIPFGLDAPNNMALIGPNLLLVTRRLQKSAIIIDLTNQSVVGSVPIGGASIAVAVLNNKAYITSGDSEYTGPFQLNVVNLSNYQIEKTIPLPESPEQAGADSTNGEIIVGTIGDYVSVPPKFYFVNATTDAITDSVIADTLNYDAELTRGSKPYVIVNTAVFPLMGPTRRMSAPIINSFTRIFYKGFYDGSTNQLYLGEYNFNASSGTVDVYDGITGIEKWSFATGIAPAHFAFYR